MGWCMLCMVHKAGAQPFIVYVASGDTMYVTAGDTLHTFGLGLTPNVEFTLTGITIQRSPVLTNPTAGRAVNRSFTFSPAASFSGLYKFWYENSELNTLNEPDLQLFYNQSSWSVAPKASHDTVNNVMTSQTVSINPVELTLSTLSSPLPVTWLGIAAQTKNKDVEVTWKTADESDLDIYTVLHSSNSTDWTVIGTAFPKGAAENEYVFLHKNAPAGKNYYRIRAKELTGEIKYSKIASVNMHDPGQLSIYPNPSTGGQNATLRLSKPGVVQIWRINGTLVSSNYYNAGVHSISTAGLTAGIYLISSGEQIIQWIIQ